MTLEYTKVINGSSPHGSPSWLTAVISDLYYQELGVEYKGLSIKLTPHFSTASEFISAVGFDLSPAGSYFATPAIQAPGASCTSGSSSAYACPSSWLRSSSGGKGIGLTGNAQAVGLFDFVIDLGTANGGNGSGQLGDGEVATFNVVVGDGCAVYCSSLIGKLGSVAKVQGIPGGGSGEVLDAPNGNGATAPGPLPVLGAAAAFGVSRRLRRRLKQPLVSSS